MRLAVYSLNLGADYNIQTNGVYIEFLCRHLLVAMEVGSISTL